MADINLLPVEEKEAESFGNLQKKLTIASVGVLVVAVVLTLGTLIFFTAVAAQRRDLNKRIDNATFEIQSNKATEELLVVVKKKATAADKLLSGRIDFVEKFEDLSKLIPQGVYFSDIKVTGLKVSLTGKAKTSADLAGLVSELVSERGTSLVSNVSIDSLNADEERVYSFTMTLNFINQADKKT